VDVEDLAQLYEEVLALAGSATFREPARGWTARSLVAHLVIHDRLLLEGLEAGVIDTSGSDDEERLSAVADPLRALARSSQDLLDFLATVTEEEEVTVLPVRMVEVGVSEIDGPMAVADLVAFQAGQHLPGHLAELFALVVRAVAPPLESEVREVPRTFPDMEGGLR